MTSARDATSLDREIGQRITLLRKLHRMSQRHVAERLGVSFQQIQRYERGENRLSPMGLTRLAILFDVPLYALFDDGVSVREGTSEALDLLTSRDTLALAQSLTAIANPKTRREILTLVQKASEHPHSIHEARVLGCAPAGAEMYPPTNSNGIDRRCCRTVVPASRLPAPSPCRCRWAPWRRAAPKSRPSKPTARWTT